MQNAKQIFNAWQIGEKTGNYDKFKSFLSSAFILFSHPLLGKFENEEALNKIKNLVAEREKLNNNLSFSEVIVLTNLNQVSFQFSSKGMVQGGAFNYEGFNIISIHFENNLFTGFQEYFGYIDPSWFKN
jgi:hypothetical protein